MFWRSLNDESALEGGTWALILGTLAAVLRYLLGSFANPEGFGVSRWVSACIDVVAFPVALPFIICLVFAVFGFISSEANYTNIAFLWLIPGAVTRALSWSSESSPILLIGVPVLWSAVIVGIGFFIRLIQSQGGWVTVPAVLGALALPLMAATSYWALFAQNSFLGIALLIICLIPMFVSLFMSFTESL